MMICTDCIGSYDKNYKTIKITDIGRELDSLDSQFVFEKCAYVKLEEYSNETFEHVTVAVRMLTPEFVLVFLYMKLL